MHETLEQRADALGVARLVLNRPEKRAAAASMIGEVAEAAAGREDGNV